MDAYKLMCEVVCLDGISKTASNGYVDLLLHHYPALKVDLNGGFGRVISHR
jgi:hypothetical protein